MTHPLGNFMKRFFSHYLPHLKGVSPYTITAYRDAFKLFLIIDIKDVHHLTGCCTVPGNTLFIDGNPDFVYFITGLNP